MKGDKLSMPWVLYYYWDQVSPGATIDNCFQADAPCSQPCSLFFCRRYMSDCTWNGYEVRCKDFYLVGSANSDQLYLIGPRAPILSGCRSILSINTSTKKYCARGCSDTGTGTAVHNRSLLLLKWYSHVMTGITIVAGHQGVKGTHVTHSRNSYLQQQLHCSTPST